MTIGAEVRGKLLSYVGTVIAAPLIWGCIPKELSEMPPKGTGNATFTTKDSAIGAEGVVSLTSLTDAAQGQIPSRFTKSGNGANFCADVNLGGVIPIKTNVCAGTRYEFTATRGPLSIVAINPTTVRLVAPIDFSGNGGFRGDGCRLLKCDAKNFSGAALVHIDVSPTVSPDWCPRLNATLGYTWTRTPSVEIAGGIWVDVSGQVSEDFNGKIEQIKTAINATVNCDLVKQELSKFYGPRAFPVTLETGNKAYVNVTPTGMGLSSLQVEPNQVRLAALLSAKVEISDHSIGTTTVPLPQLQILPPGLPTMNVAVPVRASYDWVKTALNGALAGKTFEGDTPAGRTKVLVKGVDVYPSGDRLVIGLDISADLPSTWLDVSGTVYLLAKPVVEAPTRIHLAEVGFARTLDNAFWSAATAIFERQIVAEITDAARYDAANDVERAKSLLAAALQDPKATPGFTVELSEVSMGLGRIALAESDMALEGLFSAKAIVTAAR